MQESVIAGGSVADMWDPAFQLALMSDVNNSVKNQLEVGMLAYDICVQTSTAVMSADSQVQEKHIALASCCHAVNCLSGPARTASIEPHLLNLVEPCNLQELQNVFVKGKEDWRQAAADTQQVCRQLHPTPMPDIAF